MRGVIESLRQGCVDLLLVSWVADLLMVGCCLGILGGWTLWSAYGWRGRKAHRRSTSLPD